MTSFKMPAKRIAPYIWRLPQVRKEQVVGISGIMRIKSMSTRGEVHVVDRHNVESIAPRKLAFVNCPSCLKAHQTISRRCVECKESLVYYPQPSRGKAFLFPKMEGKAAKKNFDTKEKETALQAVKTTLRAYLFNAYYLETAQQLINLELAVLDEMGPTCVLDDDFVLDLCKKKIQVVERLAKKSSETDDTINMTCCLALAADRGDVQACRRIMDLKTENGAESPYDMKILKDCFINEAYFTQSIVSQKDATDRN
eukprot:TRINITY_DN17715_c0_g1_i1.p1 TRINITY_DN17715_c0_g1~~TRINITY_DN17715_c0_g1_i1.p1  ORF type:complete len:255 (+),score=10.86 TRINITY_DN17715_c0_g1_i1:51-815(+)